MPTSAGGRPPKSGPVRHRNPVMRDTIHLKHDAKVAEVPEPSAYLTPVALAVWQRMWQSPLATLWCDADVPVLTRMVMLQTKRTWPHEVLRELRQMEDRYLLNPYARIQQRVVIDGAEDGAEAGGTVEWIDEARRRFGGTG